MEPLPTKLVDKIRAGIFVEMRELLADNISLLSHIESVQGTAGMNTLGATRPRMREVTNLTTWCYCFLGYMAAATLDPKTN